VRDLADADLDDVLAAWSGLGYYRRARLLHEAARAIVADHAGKVPEDVAALRALPGVGRYTAGAIASMVYGQPEPIVDGNVRRVIVRLEGREGDDAWVWERAAALVEAAKAPGVFNEGVMELGALVCTPRGARCGACPLRAECVAHREGRAESIPAPKAPAERRVLHQASVVVRDSRGRTLIEQRGDRGLWARMWQAPTLEGDGEVGADELAETVGLAEATIRERFTHQTTHRRVEIAVWEGRLGRGRRPRRGRWARRAEIEGLALSNPQRRILLA
jgi:A/G-specific adenine glycosylase